MDMPTTVGGHFPSFFVEIPLYRSRVSRSVASLPPPPNLGKKNTAATQRKHLEKPGVASLGVNLFGSIPFVFARVFVTCRGLGAMALPFAPDYAEHG